jgi:DNA-binding transcriptional LysR family regulator
MKCGTGFISIPSCRGRALAATDRLLRSNLKLRHLQLLVALDEFRHLGKAAEHLALTQPAVSKRLAEIERALGQRLFERSTRGTQPTLYGASIVRFARSTLADYERTRDELAALASGAAGRVSVGAMVVAIPVLLARGLRLLKTRSPETTVFVEEGDLGMLLPKLRIGELDFVVGRLEPYRLAADLETEALYDEPMVIVAGPGHPLAGRRRVSWDHLARQPWVSPPPWASLRIKFDQIFVNRGLPPARDLVETASFLAVLGALRERQALALVARSVARHFEGQGLLRILAIEFPAEVPPVGIVALRGSRPSPSAEALRDCLRRTALSLERRP